MTGVKGQRLFVNLGASQTRRRLQGFGHGVRKVQTAGRNRAMIIHTATGGHLEELKARFRDVGCSHLENDISEPIENLRNLGPASSGWLREVGVGTISDLRRLGPALAYRRVQLRKGPVSLNLLWALAAGLRDRSWLELSPEEKQELETELQQMGENFAW
ncbi:TfoX/Sxy family protein [Lignipirellula cremea]|uniref:TfoX C-terminal domain-containing protein n=1 Tax=Lignipirellula cremea TaxID=2528010 RepID=A0A518E523_9BACT|nr:TfoX/Sxy family protein [Lignipirellula cremea]QDU99190.1 hypothetical protein Pla8534_71030 [Lignipirellula cremea]